MSSLVQLIKESNLPLNHPERRSDSKTPAQIIIEQYSTIDAFTSFIFYTIQEIRAKARSPRKDEEKFESLESAINELRTVYNFLCNFEIQEQYGELPRTKLAVKETQDMFIEEYDVVNEKVRKQTVEANNYVPQLDYWLSRLNQERKKWENLTYSELVLSFCMSKEEDSAKAVEWFNRDFARIIKEDQKKEYVLHKKQAILEKGEMHASSTDLLFKILADQQRTTEGTIIGEQFINCGFEKNYSDKGIAKPKSNLIGFEVWYDAKKPLERTDLTKLKSENNNKHQEILLNAIAVKVQKAYTEKMPKQEVMMLIQQGLPLEYVHELHPNTEFFEFRTNEYCIKVGVKAEGSVNNHRVRIKAEARL